MSVPQEGGEPIHSRDDLVRYLEAGCKPGEIGASAPSTRSSASTARTTRRFPMTARAASGRCSKASRRFGWEPILEGDNIIGLKTDGAAISLEPGGQFELSGAPLENLHQTCEEIQHPSLSGRDDRPDAGSRFSGRRLLAEMDPCRNADDAQGALRDHALLYAQARAARARHDVPYNDDPGESAISPRKPTWSKKMRVGLALQPIATALFASSPFLDGKPTGYLSTRSQIWKDVDPDRTGMLPFVFEDGFGFERYVDYALDVPMYFVYRDGKYQDVSGGSFKRFLDGKLEGHEGKAPRHERLGRSSDDDLPGSAAARNSSRCAAPMAGRGRASARCRRFGSASSMIRRRSMPLGISSRAGPPRSARSCAMMCPSSASRQRSVGGRSGALQGGLEDSRSRPRRARARGQVRQRGAVP